MSAENPLSPDGLGSHVGDGNSIHLFKSFGVEAIDLPVIFGFQITKFMVLELMAVVVMMIIFLPLARKIRSGKPIHGRFWNMMEAFLLFFRDQVARPAIGHDADKFLPIIWTTFFFVLFCNLFGMIPCGGSPTASFAVTGVLAGVAFVTAVIAGTLKFGPVKFWLNQVPHMEVPFGMGYIMKPMLFVIEVFGLCVKFAVLAIRLFANMFAGHLMLAVFMAFVGATAGLGFLWYAISFPCLTFIIALSFLEIFVAFLQAYIFTFLTALFIGMATHSH